METTDTLKAVTMLKTYFWWLWLTDGSLWIKLPENKFFTSIYGKTCHLELSDKRNGEIGCLGNRVFKLRWDWCLLLEVLQ